MKIDRDRKLQRKLYRRLQRKVYRRLPLPGALVFVLFVLSLGGCLQTRSTQKEVEEKQVLRKQVSNLQQTTAEVNAKFNEIDEDTRKLSGRVDQLDSRLSNVREKAEKNDAALEAKIKDQDTQLNAFREEVSKLAKDLAETRAIAQSALQAMQSGQSVGAAGVDKKDPFRFAEAKFEEKAFREAIFAYEEYRKAFPKGKNVTQATYKIGVAFQELGMNDDAKLFFEEVVAKSPKSKEAGLARNRLKAMPKGNKRSPSGEDD